MLIVYNVLLVLHFIGLASLLGGVIVQARSPEKGVNPAMLHGALLQLVTGVLMVGVYEMDKAAFEADGVELAMAKIGIKLAVVLVITVLAFIGRRRQPPQVGLWATIGLLTLANIIIAVFV